MVVLLVGLWLPLQCCLVGLPLPQLVQMLVLVSADVDAAAAAARLAMRWTTNTSGFVLKRMSQLIESGARADKGFKEKEVNQVAKLLRVQW